VWSLSPGKVKNFLFSTSSRPTLGPTQPPIQWVLGALSPGLKKPGREADHLPPTRVEVKQHGSIHPLPHTSSWSSAKLVKHRDNFAFTLVYKRRNLVFSYHPFSTDVLFTAFMYAVG
jgi:hypothetical protein